MKQTKKAIGIAFTQILLTALSFVSVMYPARAQKISECNVAIQSVKNDIEQRLGGVISSVNTRKLSNSPYNQNLEVSIQLFNYSASGDDELPSGVRDWSEMNQRVKVNRNLILHSPVLRQSYAQSIVDNCEPAVRVQISMRGVWHELVDIDYSWSLHPREGKDVLMEDQCIPRGLERRYASDLQYGIPQQVRWGYKWCLENSY